MAGQCDIGLTGLAVMGRNLVLNMADHGFTVGAYNRTTEKVDELVEGEAAGKPVVGCRAPEELVAALKRPRRVMLMVKAGKAVDAVIEQFAPMLEAGDILIDGGNSLYTDTERRLAGLAGRGILYVGAGISGGEEGARHGPSIMPGGSPDAWPHLRDILQGIAAKAGPGGDVPCCDWLGPGGAGHYVKMVHNGIEYGNMQLLCEAYALLGGGLGLEAGELYDVFADWNEGELDSYLLEITRDIFSVTDGKTGRPLVEVILDRAEQKGTGRWTARDALELGVPLTLITEAVFTRSLSALKDERARAADALPGRAGRVDEDRGAFIESLRRALYASVITSYAQGFAQLRAASAEHGWDLDFAGVASLWRGGCIIRAALLEPIMAAFERVPALENLLLDARFAETVTAYQPAWRHVVSTAVRIGIPVPALASALCFFDGYRSARLPHNLLQAQRDYFGAHTYERVDEGGTFHTDWLAQRREPAAPRPDHS